MNIRYWKKSCFIFLLNTFICSMIHYVLVLLYLFLWTEIVENIRKKVSRRFLNELHNPLATGKSLSRRGLLVLCTHGYLRTYALFLVAFHFIHNVASYGYSVLIDLHTAWKLIILTYLFVSHIMQINAFPAFVMCEKICLFLVFLLICVATLFGKVLKTMY